MASKLSVSVLPDFFFDRIISVPSIQDLTRRIGLKAQAGGGSLRGLKQVEMRGGNATNLAFAMSSLSARTTLYVVADSNAQVVVSQQPHGCKVRFLPGRPGYTTSLEFPFRGRTVNVMLSDVGDIANFDGARLTKKDMGELRKSDCLALVNWSANVKGNELARRVFSLPGRGRRLHFMDTADLSGAESRARVLIKKVIGRGLIDVLSLNENEARIMAKILSVRKLSQEYNRQEILNTSKEIHDSLSVTIDVHTPIGSASSSDQCEVWADSFGNVDGFVTGAGDVWDAGDILGHLLHFDDKDRLQFANACAYFYVKGEKERLPTLREVITFLRKRSLPLPFRA